MLKLIIAFLIVPLMLFSQSRWKRSKSVKKIDIELFHSTQTANLPTTETLKKGDFMYEISHRFGRISDGYDALYGFDGPVNMRTALSYGVTDHFMLTMGRSSVLDNFELKGKLKLWQLENKAAPSVFAVQFGATVSTEPAFDLEAFNTDYMQFYGQLIYNVMLMDKKLGIGIVPSYVYNSYIFAARNNLDTKYTFALGSYYQYYFNRLFSLWAEFSPVISGWQGPIFSNPGKENRSYSTIAFGTAIETGGHIFHLFVTNSTRLNAVQYLVGSDGDTDKDAWHLAFSITREL
jgi:Membrane bound beta barrel domain (DUF5777)